MTLEPGRPELFTTSTKGASKLPIVALAAVLVGLVVVTRLGGTDQTTSAAPTHRLGSPTSAPGTAAPTPFADTADIVGLFPVSPDGLTYADGIPTSIDGVPVIRVHDALQLPVGRTELIAGWYRARNCRATTSRCPSPTLSDVPLELGFGDVRTEFVALNERLVGSGGRVVLATTEEDPDCSIHIAGACQSRLAVAATVWSTSDVEPPAKDDEATLELIAAVNDDPDSFAGAFIHEDQLVVMYVHDGAMIALQEMLSSDVAVHWRKVDRSWSELVRLLAEVRSLGLEGVSGAAIDIVYNRVDVYYDGLPIEVVIRLQDQYDGAVVFFRGGPAGQR